VLLLELVIAAFILWLLYPIVREFAGAIAFILVIALLALLAL
jgi:hypothetical protein